MKKKLLIPGVAMALAAALAVAGCGGGGGGGGSATAAVPSTSGKTVAVADIGGAGKVLVDSSGQALYASDQDRLRQGDVHRCLQLVLEAADRQGGGRRRQFRRRQAGVVKRPDGTKQVTDNGKLLYTFTQEGPGQVTGDGFQDAFNGQQFTWHVVSVGNGGSTSSGSSSNGGRAAAARSATDGLCAALRLRFDRETTGPKLYAVSRSRPGGKRPVLPSGRG
jgi:predicted lipoprotein with Yx(FWY)xxD motif